MEVIAVPAVDNRRVSNKFEAQNVAVELHGRGHVEDLQERTDTVKVKRHVCPPIGMENQGREILHLFS
jgi:hypothetical protein